MLAHGFLSPVLRLHAYDVETSEDERDGEHYRIEKSSYGIDSY